MSERSSKISLVPFQRIDELCPEAEPLLIGAMRNNGEGLIVVNNVLMKLRGRLVGVSLDDQDPMKAGRWYTPNATNTRDTIRSAFDDGMRAITILGEEEWIDFRRIRATHDDNNRYLQPPELLRRIQEMAVVVRREPGLKKKAQRIKYRVDYEDLS